MLRKIGKKKTLIAALAVVLAAALLIALLPNGKADTSSVKVVEELLSAKAEYGTINTVFTSGGAISNSGTESIALAGSVKLRSWEVSEGRRYRSLTHSCRSLTRRSRAAGLTPYPRYSTPP